MEENFTFTLFKNSAELFSSCMKDYLYVYDFVTDIYYISESAEQRFAIPSHIFSHFLEKHHEFIYGEDLPLFDADIQEIFERKKTTHDLRYRWLDKSGKPVWIDCQGKVLTSPDGELILLIGCINEIGDKQMADNVSGLLRDEVFKEQLRQFRGLPECYILRLGIDNFKDINERLGNEYGDQVLNDVAECIQECLQPGQYAYRMPSDEYLIFDLLSKSRKEAGHLYREIRRRNDELLEQRYYEVIYTISCGVVSYEDLDRLDYDQITMLSHYALSMAKLKGKNRLYYFNQDDYDHFVLNQKITQDLRRSVSKDFHGFELFFQPIMHATTGEVFAAEALIRYRGEDGKLVPPYAFITQLEESGLIIPLGRWIIQTALEACVECQKHKPDFKVSINLSYVQLLKSPIYTDLVDAIEDSGIAPESVIVELTESGYLNENSAVTNVWRKLKQYGVLIAIDDFGTGYSNLMNISNLRPDILKIDREFTGKALSNHYEKDLLVHIIEMVQSLGIRGVVEGVENQEELERVVSLGPDYIQGYYYSRPCPIPEFMNRFMVGEVV